MTEAEDRERLNVLARLKQIEAELLGEGHSFALIAEVMRECANSSLKNDSQ